MKITRTSPFSGVEHTREIDVTQEQLDRWQGGQLIQNAMPNLSPDDREFLMTGITPEEWEETFGGEEEEDPDNIPAITDEDRVEVQRRLDKAGM